MSESITPKCDEAITRLEEPKPGEPGRLFERYSRFDTRQPAHVVARLAICATLACESVPELVAHSVAYYEHRADLEWHHRTNHKIVLRVSLTMNEVDQAEMAGNNRLELLVRQKFLGSNLQKLLSRED